MKKPSIALLLKQKGLRDTQPRRLVLDALSQDRGTFSPQKITERIASKGHAANLVTVYRVLAAFEKLGLVHRHPCDGSYTLCSLPEEGGHHGFLHCSSCGHIEEFSDEELRRAQNTVARGAKFRPVTSVSELIGICSSCAA